jgi:hypothetical protein
MAARLALAAAAGLVVGALTESSVLHVPFSLEPLGNTAAPWVLLAFGMALTARRTDESLLLAVTTFIALVVGFYVTQVCRGWPASRHQIAFWIVASVIMGPVVGVAAGWLRRGGRMTAALAAGGLGGVLTGEAVYGLTGQRFSSPAEYWHVQFVLGVSVAVAATLWRSRRHLLDSVPALAVSLAACAVVGLGTVGAYNVV